MLDKRRDVQADEMNVPFLKRTAGSDITSPHLIATAGLPM